jgi:hypothetical protein
MLNLERIPDQTGYLLLAEDGAVISVSIMMLYIATNCVAITKNNELQGTGPFLRADSCAATQELPTFYRTGRVITVFTLAFHRPLS